MSHSLDHEPISDRMAQLIRRTLDSGWRKLRFEHELERSFERYYHKRYFDLNRAYAFIGALAYALFLFTDRLLIPEVAVEAATLRLTGAFLIIATLLVSRLEWIERNFQWMLCAGTFFIYITVLVIAGMAVALGEYHYQSGPIQVMIFLCMVLRIRFRYVLPFALLAWLVQTFSLYFFLDLSDSHFTDLVSVSAFVAAIGLLVNYRVEHESRKTFLQQALLMHEQKCLVEARNELEQLSMTDALTGLANGRSFDGFIETEWYRAVRQRQPVSLLMIDVDHFKSYNDNYGHQQGDECLKVVAHCLGGSARRASDLVARYGGEEFAIVLPHTELENARLLAEKARQRVYEHNMPHGYSSAADRVTVSIGIACLVPTPELSLGALIKIADEALYEAKGAGRNRVFPS